MDSPLCPQAVACLRQKKVGDTAKQLNNLVSCEAAVPTGSAALEWKEKDELADLFSAYCSKEKGAEKQAAVAALLGISEADAAGLRDIVEQGGWKIAQEEQQETAFF